MKKLLFLLMPLCIFAQSNFKKLDSLQFKEAVDQLLKDTAKDFVYDSTGETNGTGHYYRYIDSVDSKNTLLITFETYFAERNTDLQIPGVKKWDIIDIYGKYLSLFPIWKKYYQKDANKEAISKSNSAPIKGFPDYSFRRYEGEIWNIGL